MLPEGFSQDSKIWEENKSDITLCLTGEGNITFIQERVIKVMLPSPVRQRVITIYAN